MLGVRAAAQQVIDRARPFVGGRVRQKCLQLGHCRNFADQVQIDAPQKLGVVGGRGRFDLGPGPGVGQRPVDVHRQLAGVQRIAGSRCG